MIRATGINLAGRGPGAVAIEEGADTQSKASTGIAAAAKMEAERQGANEQIKASNQAGNAAAGAAVGGIVGSFFGPGYGTMIGSALGGLIGRSF